MTQIDGYDVAITGTLPSILIFHKDKPGVVAAVTKVLSSERINIANMYVGRNRRGHSALMLIKTDAPPPEGTLGRLRELAKVSSATYIAPVQGEQWTQ